MPNTITTLPSYMINSFDRANQLTIPSSVTELSAYAINYVGGATNRPKGAVSIPENISIANDSLKNCYFERLSIPKTIKAIPNNFSYGFSLAKRAFMSNEVTTFGSQVLYGWSKLRKVDLPDALTSIGDSFLYNCYNLTEIRIPNGVTQIGSSFGYNWLSLNELVIPASVVSIGTQFLNTTSGIQRVIVEGATTLSNSANNATYALTEIIYLSENVPSRLVKNSQGMNVFVPDAAYDAYYAKHGTSSAKVYKLSEYRGVFPDYVQQKGM